MPLLYTERLTTPVYSRGGACPRPGRPPISPKVRAYGGATLWSPVVEESEKEMMYSSTGNPILSLEDESSITSSIHSAEKERPYILAVDDDQSILSMLMPRLES